MTRILSASDPDAIREAAALLRAGELVAFPTETVYGLGANALDAEAAARIFIAKGRPATDPLIVHIHHIDQLKHVARDIPQMAYPLIARFWPGALTLVLPRADAVPPNVSAGLATVAVRMPVHLVARALLVAADLPIAAPSANRFAHTSPTTAHHVYDDLHGRIPLILDGGAAQIGVESTILDLTSDPPLVLRPGGVALEELRDLLPTVGRLERYVHPNEEAMPAPGMLLKHYSPRAELRLYDGEPDAVRKALFDTARALTAQGRRVGVLLAEEDHRDENISGEVIVLGSLHDLETVAQRLFASLRTLDERGVDVILARGFPNIGIGAAVQDRLVRAAEGKVIRISQYPRQK
jgi:L-threonylcarbamoyladenylate synthase